MSDRIQCDSPVDWKCRRVRDYDPLEKLPGYQLIHRREDGEVRTPHFNGRQLLAEIYDRSNDKSL